MAANVFQPGDVCGKNRVVRLIGSGGFSEVYEALDERGKRRALKVIATDETLASKLAALEARLAQEGEALARIEHVNVVRFYDAGVHAGHAWLLLELIEGRNLREALRARAEEPSVGDETPEPGAPPRAPIEVPLRWVRQACEGVAEAHRVGAIHRDLKPENLLVTGADVVKVIDFGIAKLQSFGLRTTQQQLLGTALYMAPELIEGAPPDARVDVYAMGLVLYEALAGFHPIDGGRGMTMMELYRRQLAVRPAPLVEIVKSVPAELSGIVERAIAKDPARRIASMRELADALHGELLAQREGRRAAARNVPVAAWTRALAAAEAAVDAEAATAPSGVMVDAAAATAEIAAEPSGSGGAAPQAVAPAPRRIVARPPIVAQQPIIAPPPVASPPRIVGPHPIVAPRVAPRRSPKRATLTAAILGAILGVSCGVVIYALAIRLLAR